MWRPASRVCGACYVSEHVAVQARLDEQAFILEEQKLEYTAAAAQLAAMQARIDALGARLPSAFTHTL